MQGKATHITLWASIRTSKVELAFITFDDLIVMVASYLPPSYLISVSILSNLGAHLISYLIYGCGLVSS